MPAAHEIAGRRIAVTGGARGIGAAIAATLTRQGALVAIGDLDPGVADPAAAQAALRLDVTSETSCAEWVAESERALGGPLDVLVLNAGIMWVGSFALEPDAAALRQFDVNVHGVMRGIRLVVPAMWARGSGHVVVIASAASKVAPSGEASYAATKHAVYGYCAGVRAELGPTSPVDLSVVMPGVVETELAAGTSPGRGARRLAPQDVADAVADVVRRPRFEVPVPRAVGAFTRLQALLPQAARDRVNRLIIPDQLRDTDAAVRTAYETRSLDLEQRPELDSNQRPSP